MSKKQNKAKSKVPNNKEKEGTIPTYKELIRVALNSLDVSELSKSQCFRPDLYLDNGRNCEGCSFYSDCNLSLKRLPKGIIFDGENFVEKKQKS